MDHWYKSALVAIFETTGIQHSARGAAVKPRQTSNSPPKCAEFNCPMAGGRYKTGSVPKGPAEFKRAAVAELVDAQR